MSRTSRINHRCDILHIEPKMEHLYQLSVLARNFHHTGKLGILILTAANCQSTNQSTIQKNLLPERSHCAWRLKWLKFFCPISYSYIYTHRKGSSSRGHSKKLTNSNQDIPQQQSVLLGTERECIHCPQDDWNSKDCWAAGRNLTNWEYKHFN